VEGPVVIGDLLAQWAESTPDTPFALFADGIAWTFAETAQQAWSAANGLAALGIKKGDTVLCWLPSGPTALRTWFGANTLGAAYVPLNPAYRGGLLEHAINTSGARVMVAHAALVDRLAAMQLTALRQVVVIGKTSQELAVEVLDERALTGPASAPTSARVAPWDTLALIYTSGTTGASKAVRCSYQHHATYCEGLFPTQSSNDRWLVSVPMFHVAGTTAVYGALQRGGSVAILEGFRTAGFFDDIRRFGATHTTIIGAMATFLLNAPPRPDDRDHTLRTALIVPLVSDPGGFSRRFGVQVFTGYGGTEVTCPIRSDYAPQLAESCGRAWNSEYELRIVDEHDQEVPTGAVGELMVRHATPWSLTDGYDGMPDATARLWRNGWLHTGDALRVDADGNYFFVDRIKDAIRRRGENISSLEVEHEIMAHPDVLEAAVVAVAAAEGEDEVRAFVVMRAGTSLGPRELAEWLIPRLAHFMVPRYIDLLDDFPRTDSQKIRKAALRDRPLDSSTWDREAAGLRLRGERLSEAH